MAAGFLLVGSTVAFIRVEHFSLSECQLLVNAVSSALGINLQIKKYGEEGFRLYVPTHESEKFFRCIGPHLAAAGYWNFEHVRNRSPDVRD